MSQGCFKQKVRQLAVVVYKRECKLMLLVVYCLVTQGYTRPNTVLYYKK